MLCVMHTSPEVGEAGGAARQHRLGQVEVLLHVADLNSNRFLNALYVSIKFLQNSRTEHHDMRYLRLNDKFRQPLISQGRLSRRHQSCISIDFHSSLLGVAAQVEIPVRVGKLLHEVRADLSHLAAQYSELIFGLGLYFSGNKMLTLNEVQQCISIVSSTNAISLRMHSIAKLNLTASFCIHPGCSVEKEFFRV